VIEPSAFEREVGELHAFFERWYAGESDRSEIVRLDVLDESFVMIGPDGRLLPVDDVKAMIETAYGRHPMKIEIRNVVLVPGKSHGTYEEWQTVDGSTSGRISTVVMANDRHAPNGLRWMHLHETWLPAALR